MSAALARIGEGILQNLLTKSEDRLIAISDLAKEISYVSQEEYYAGPWYSPLPQMLLWRTTGHNRMGTPRRGLPTTKPRLGHGRLLTVW